jgi:transposase
VFLFVATLGYSRRMRVRAFRHERQESWLRGAGAKAPLVRPTLLSDSNAS